MFNFFKKNKDNEEQTLSADLNENGAKEAKGAFCAFKNAFSKTSDAIVGSILNIVSSSDKLDEFVLEDVETALIKADIGVDLAVSFVEEIEKQKIKPDEIKTFLKNKMQDILSKAGSNELKYEEDKLNIYFITGINGAGKTTLIGKLANKFKNEGKKVLLAAGDTFRAAAEEQLDIWSKRAGVDIIREDKKEAAAVVYKAIETAQNGGYNVLIVDTAGRLQNKFNLIEELKKTKNVIDKKAQDANFESILVLDANLGQNGLSQAKVFKEAVEITGVALTKLDGSSKGGVILAVANEYNIPVKLVGVGEKIDDLKEFNKEEFIKAIFEV